MINKNYCFLMFFIFLGCIQRSENKRDLNMYLNDSVSVVWRGDSSDCYIERRALLKQNKIDYKRFIGLRSNELRDLLGVPDIVKFNKDSVYFYLITCKYQPIHKMDSTIFQKEIDEEGEGLLFVIRRDTVNYAYHIIP